MNLKDLMEQILSEPALIDEIVLRKPGKIWGETIEVPQMTVKDGIAEIPIGGVIGTNLKDYQRGMGAVDVGEVTDDIDQAESDPKVRSILFNVDSPGGMVSGTPELADRISAITKPNFAFTNGLMASAAYWAMSSTRAIMATKTANVGSIGVLLPVMDYSGAFAQAGIKVELITAGKLKGVGYPGTSLTESGKAHLQERVDEIYGMFKSHVSAMRQNRVKDEDMQGQTFLGERARAKGFIDLIVRDKAQVLAMLR